MPLVWALTGSRVGDNKQVQQFCAALGFDVHEVPLNYGALRMVPNWLMGASRASVRRPDRDQLKPPWPDIVIGAGQRSVPVARWVQKQSGGATKIVFLGRPRAPLDWFDLVVTTPQYGLPEEENVMLVRLPYVEQQLVPLDAGKWLARWSTLPRPLTAVVVGGSTAPYKLDAGSIRRLVQLAGKQQGEGSVVFATSPRTSEAETSMLVEEARGVGEICTFAKGAPNPYPALLAEADQFIVTEDSVTMIAEAVVTGKPVTVSKVKHGPVIFWRAETGPMRALAARGILAPPRNVRRLVRMLAADGTLSFAGDDGKRAEVPELAKWSDALTVTRRLVG